MQPVESISKNLLNCAPCAPSRIRAVPIINMWLTRLLVFTRINNRFTDLCLVLLQIPLCLLKQPWTHAKMRIFSFRPEIPFLDKFGPKNQNCQSELKFGTYTDLNMQNSMVMLTFSVFDQKYLFLANLVQKTKIVSLKVH